MRPVKFVILVMLCITSTIANSQGASCTNPHVMALDTVSRNYTVSPTSGNAAHCNTSEFSGSGKITIFRFTTDASASCVLVHVSSSAPVQPVEIAMYTGCGGSGACSGLQSTSSVCFSDGAGYWAPFEQYVLAPNTTYYLRVWTPAAGTLTMSARNYPPPNNLCSGASYISTVPITDQNACNKASTEVTPIQLCAFSLENTAFYTYYVENNGVSSIQLNNIACDNAALGVDNTGFQIGFFVGTCGALTKIACDVGAGGSISATTGWLPAGTQVFVAIDGNSGSNCSYTITAFNAMVLPVTIKYFTAWKRADANRLTWMTTSEKSFSHFEIEKSTDAANFIRVANVAGRGRSNGETSYTYDDNDMKAIQYYRLKYVDIDGKYTYSNVIRVNRDDVTTKVIFNNKITDLLALRIVDMPVNNLSIKIIDNSGRTIKTQSVKINPGENSVNVNTGSIPSGFYYLMLSSDNYKRTFSFVKS